MVKNLSGIVEVTSRTLQGRFFMRPSPEINKLILGILGRAQAKYPVELFAFIFMSNHLHILMRVDSAKQMAGFMGFVKANIAKELGKLHGWKGTFWGARYHHAPLSDNDAEQVLKNRFMYILSNSCKEGLVDSPLDWPGVSTAVALYHGKMALSAKWYDRTAECLARQRGERKESPSTETVRLSLLPFLQDLTPEAQREFFVNAVHQIERETREQNEALGRRSLGARKVERTNPLDGPDSFHPSRAPRFHAATLADFLEMRAAHRLEVTAYREAAERLRKGHTDAQFPEGCFPPPAPFVETRPPP